MRTFVIRFVLAVGIASAATPTSAAPPTIDELRAIWRENADRLNSLHLQCRSSDSYTEAYREQMRRHAENTEKVLTQLKGLKRGDGPTGMPASLAETKAYLKDEVRFARYIAAQPVPPPAEDRFEFFKSGEQYQVRSPGNGASPVQPDFHFPDVPVTPETLMTDYADVRIFSYSHQMSPPARRWDGVSRSDLGSEPKVVPRPAVRTSQHLGERAGHVAPPFMSVVRPQCHPFDDFFAESTSHRVVGEEVRDGKRLVVIDAVHVSAATLTISNHDGQTTYHVKRHYRAWVDREQGGLPVRLERRDWKTPPAVEDSMRTPADEVTTTTEVRRLDGGGHYPTATHIENFGLDPSVDPASIDWARVRTGEAPAPKYVVMRRRFWTTQAIDGRAPGDAEFYVIRFPEGQTYRDDEPSRGGLFGLLNLFQ